MDDEAADWLDKRVYDCRGDLVGSVVGVYDGTGTNRPAWLAIGMGTFGLRTGVVPVRGAVVWGSDVVLAHERQTIIRAPRVGVVETLIPEDEALLAEHYAHPPNPFHAVPPESRSAT